MLRRADRRGPELDRRIGRHARPVRFDGSVSAPTAVPSSTRTAFPVASVRQSSAPVAPVSATTPGTGGIGSGGSGSVVSGSHSSAAPAPRTAHLAAPEVRRHGLDAGDARVQHARDSWCRVATDTVSARH